jgi:hypothetical protein
VKNHGWLVGFVVLDLAHGRHHVSAGISALGEDLCTELAVVVIVLGALVGALLAGVGAQFGCLSVKRRVARTHPGTLRGEVGDIPAETETLGHLLAMVSALVSAPLTRLSGLEAAVYTPVHLVGQVINL